MQQPSPLACLILAGTLLSSCDSGKPPQQAEPVVPAPLPEPPAQVEQPNTIADAIGPSAAESLAAICEVSESDIPDPYGALLSVIPGDNTLQDEQQKWLDETLAHCSQPKQDTQRCCRSAIQWRSDEIRRYPYSSNMLFVYDNERDTVRMDGLMQDHILELAVVPAVDCPEDCKDRQLAITHTGTSAPEGWQQNIELPGLDFSLSPDGKILLDGREIADTPEELIWVEDFNFDGHQDFAVFSGYAGTKGAQTRHIFLFDPDRNYGFSYAPALSELTYAQVFEVSHTEDGGVLHTFNKNSASSSVSSKWKVVNNLPQEITRFTLDLEHITEDGHQGTLAVSQHWRDGQWHTQEEFTPDEDEP